MMTWERKPFYLACATACDRPVVWLSRQPITASSPGEDKGCLLAADLPVGAQPEHVGDGLVETMVMRQSMRCDVI